MRVSVRVRPGTTGGAALALLRGALLLFGFGCLAAFLWLQYQSRVVHSELREQFADRVRQAAEGAPAAPAAANGVVGRLRSDRLGLDVMVLEGEEEVQLRRGAGLIAGTAYPGQPGNVGLAAHRDTFFRPLREVKAGDRLELETLQGRYEYEVEWTRIVEPSAVEVLDPTAAPALTLVTCYPFNYVGSAPQRFIVRAKRTAAPPVQPQVAVAARPDASGAVPSTPKACGATAAVMTLQARGKEVLAAARQTLESLATQLRELVL